MLAAWFGVNATDEPLSNEALAAVNVPPPPAPSENNGYLDFLALGEDEAAPTYETALSHLHNLNNQRRSQLQDASYLAIPNVRIDARVPNCGSAELSCFEAAEKHTHLQELFDSHRGFLRRYRAMREKPEFIGLDASTDPGDAVPAYQALFRGQRLAQLAVADQFNTADRISALKEVEKEYAFHRKLAIGSRTLVGKMISYALLDRDALFAAEMARRLAANETALWRKLEALTRVPTKEELDIVPSLKQEAALKVSWLQSRRYLQDSFREMGRQFSQSNDARPWWEPVAQYLYRPHQTANMYASRAKILLALAELPSSEFVKAREAAMVRARAIEPGLAASIVLNPVGHFHCFFCEDVTDYIARMHSFSGMQTLVHLQVKLRAAGITEPDPVTAALEGPLGRSHLDPFSGNPMRFDPNTGTIGFHTEAKYVSAGPRPLVYRYGRMALPALEEFTIFGPIATARDSRAS